MNYFNFFDEHMRKTLFFALVLVASAIAFTACKDNGNSPESQNVDPKNVTVKDLVGEWRVDSTFFNNEIDRDGRYAIVVTDKYILKYGYDTIPYKLENGVITVELEDYNWQTDATTKREAHLEILSFDKGLKRASFKEADAQDYEGNTGVKMIYVRDYPQPTGKDVAINESNIKGDWLIEYEEYRDGDQPLSKQVSPHWIFQIYGENHLFIDLLATDPHNYWDSYPHPGFWWYRNGEIASMSSNKDFDDIKESEITGGWWKVEKLTENFMILHDTWETGESYKYLSRVVLPDEVKKH